MREVIMERYTDGRGLDFGKCRELLPTRASDFPKRHIVKDREALAAFHLAWNHCMVCGRTRPVVWTLEAHHMIGGANGRSDEATVLLMLCGPSVNSDTCHARAHGGDLELGQLLWVKWARDRAAVDWVRLSILYGRFLPDLQPDEAMAEIYRRNRSVGKRRY